MTTEEKLLLLSLLIKYINTDKYLNFEDIKKREISIDLIITNIMLEYLN